MPSRLIGFLVVLLIAVAALAASGSLWHWFLIPVFICGALVASDAVEWIRGGLGLFDPAGLIAVLALHVSFICPILIVVWNYRLRYLSDQPEDYRPWLGILATFTALGLVLYHLILRHLSPRVAITRMKTVRLNRQRYGVVLGGGLLLSAVLQAGVYQKLGGLSGYIGAYSAWLHGEDMFQGMAPVFAVSESFPIILMMIFAVWSHGASWRRGWLVILPMLLMFVVLDMLFGGLRGSRSNILWGVFWAVGIIHFYVRPVPRTAAIAILPVLIAFLGAYAVFKNYGEDSMQFLERSEDYSQIENGSERLSDVIVGDLGRSDGQAYLLYKTLNPNSSFDYALGGSYLGALTMIIPHSVWPGRPPGKDRWTTDLEYGPGAFAAGTTPSSRVYGLAGEAILNFGPYSIPFIYVALAAFVAWVRRIVCTLAPGDSRRLFVPCLCNFCLIVFLNDSDNQVFFLLKYALFPGLLIWASSTACTVDKSGTGRNNDYIDLTPRFARAESL